MSKYLKCFIAIALLVVVGVGFTYRAFFGEGVERTETIYITEESLLSDGYDTVIEEVLLPHIKHHAAFSLYANYLNLPERIKSGRYELREGMSIVDVVRMLKLGNQEPIFLVFNNIRTPEQLAGRLAQQIEADSLTILKSFSSAKVLEMAGFENKEALMSIFVPNTYEVYWNITPESLVARMSREYNKFWSDQNGRRDNLRKKLNLSRLEVSTLASIVYEETIKEDEMPRVAGVYINRLKRGMKLQADPTVRYANGDFEIKRVLYKHLKCDSPYNTYIYKGLPPTPIAMPSIAAIDAVLEYEKHDYLFFCARAVFDGYHNFSKTLREHNANSRSYSKELDNRSIK